MRTRHLPVILVWLGICFSCVTCASEEPNWGSAVWHNLNPGGGGNIQSVSLDPSVPGRMYLCSDMEGAYRSDDTGDSWQQLSAGLSDTYMQCLTAEPGDSGRLYAGSVSALDISDDRGTTWRRAVGIFDAIGGITIDPTNVKRLYAWPGQRYRWDSNDEVTKRRRGADTIAGPWGRQSVYISDDRGDTWRTSAWSNTVGRRDVLSCDITADGKELWLGALAGIQRSRDRGTTWEAIPGPLGTGDCLGSTLSPDGAILYACYRLPGATFPTVKTGALGSLGAVGHSSLFATRTANIAWQDLGQGMPGFSHSRTADHTMWWRPRIDPRSTATQQRLLLGTYRPQHGVWEVTVTWPTTPLPALATWQRVLWYEPGADSTALAWDHGWEQWSIIGEDVHYAPLTWDRPVIVASGGQTLYRTARDTPDFHTTWQPIYTRKIGEIAQVPTYRTRGFQSTFTFDGTANGSYAIQSQGDNGILESFDGGWSWTGATKPGGFFTSRSNAVAILDRCDPPIVVVHVATGWGAASNSGELWAKRLQHRTPADTWMRIAGGEAGLAGIPGLPYNRLVVDPHQPKRLYVATFGRGIFSIDDVPALLTTAERAAAGQHVAVPLASSPTATAAVPKPKYPVYQSAGLAVDPITPEVLYAAEATRLYRGERHADDWQWTLITPPGFDHDMCAWARGDTCWLAARVCVGNSESLMVSADRGATWTPLLTATDAAKIRNPAWLVEQSHIAFGGLVGHQDRLFFGVQTDILGGMRSAGYLGARLNGSTLVGVDDLTADHPWPYPVNARLVTDGEVDWLYLSTRGEGLWRRPVP